MPNKQSSAGGNMPTGVKVISVLYYIFAGLLALLGILAIAVAEFIGNLLGNLP